MAIPDIEGIDYTTKEYLKFATHINNAADRLNKSTEETRLNESTEETEKPEDVRWTPHKVELALWTHYVVSEHKPELLSSKFPLNHNRKLDVLKVWFQTLYWS